MLLILWKKVGAQKKNWKINRAQKEELNCIIDANAFLNDDNPTRPTLSTLFCSSHYSFFNSSHFTTHISGFIASRFSHITQKPTHNSISLQMIYLCRISFSHSNRNSTSIFIIIHHIKNEICLLRLMFSFNNNNHDFTPMYDIWRWEKIKSIWCVCDSQKERIIKYLHKKLIIF